jgi:hypothetical protein
MNNNEMFMHEIILICMLFESCCRHVLKFQGSGRRLDQGEEDIVEVDER